MGRFIDETFGEDTQGFEVEYEIISPTTFTENRI